MKGKHTVAPWRVIGADEIVSAKGYDVARLLLPCRQRSVVRETSEKKIVEMAANALLISVAPDLLQALEFVLKRKGELGADGWKYIANVIASATGGAK